MPKTETINFNDFMRGDWREKKAIENLQAVGNVVALSSGTLVLFMPESVSAASMDGTFDKIHESVMTAFDAGVVLIICFSGAAWCLGHRGKAIEILLGVCCGYLLARHSVDIRDFLKGI